MINKRQQHGIIIQTRAARLLGEFSEPAMPPLLGLPKNRESGTGPRSWLAEMKHILVPDLGSPSNVLSEH